MWSKISTAFLAGLVLGALAFGSFTAKVLPSYSDTAIRLAYRSEAERHARRAEQEGDLLRAMVHRWNATDASREDWFQFSRYLETDNKKLSPWFPIGFYLFNQVASGHDADRLEEIEGKNRGNLAWMFEENGFPERAEEEWISAASLMGLDSAEEARDAIAANRASFGEGMVR